ncbi:MAG: MSCRAMM family adhesin SdrC [Lachnospiraceae bacterium]
MIQHKKILTGLMTAALILSSHSAMTWSVYASEQQETEDSTAAVTNMEATSESEKKTEVNSEAEAEKSTNTTAEVTSEKNSEAASDTGSEKNSESASDKNSEMTSENGSEKNSEVDSEKSSDTTSENGSEKNSETSSDTDSEKNSETPSEMESETSTEPTTEMESEENTETETESETQTESATASEETETQTETEEVPDSSVPADVFKVILPTIPEDDTTFDYILDPQGLIELTDAKKYGGTDEVAFEHDKTLYFKTSRTEDGRPVYDNVSNALTVTNMSSREVKITVKATIANSESITMSESSTFDADDTSTSIYLALTDGTNTIPITSDAAVLNAVINAPEDAYETVWDGEKNVYELTDTAKKEDYDGFQKYSFWLTGACNANADWSNVEGQIPEVFVVWEVKNE